MRKRPPSNVLSSGGSAARLGLPVPASSPAPLDRRTLLAYALPAVPIAALGFPLLAYLPPFYAEHVGFDLGLVGALFMVARLWDVVTDPVLGVISDRWPSRWGRRRHWLVASVPPIVAGVLAVFLPGPHVTPAWLLSWLLVLYVGFTLLSISHLSWGAELHPGYHERSRVQAWSQVAFVLGMVLALAVPAIVERSHAGAIHPARVTALGVVVLVTLIPAVALAVTRVGEHPAARPRRMDWRGAGRAILANAMLRHVVAGDVLAGLTKGVIGSTLVFLATWWLGLGHRAGLIFLVHFVSGAAVTPLWMRLSYRLGKPRTVTVGALAKVFTLPLVLLLPHGHLGWTLAWAAVTGCSLSVAPFLLRSMTADAAASDEASSGVPRTGLYYSVLTFTDKTGMALGVGLTYLALEHLGFRATGPNPWEAVSALVWLAIGAPVLLQALLAAVMWRCPASPVLPAATPAWSSGA